MSLIEVKVPSLELNWLSKRYKGIPNPKIVFDDSAADFSGRYCYPGYSDEIIDLPNPTGIIHLIDFTPDVIAHEYRHHLQWWYKGPSIFDNQIDPDYDMSGYYKHPIEVDANRFEYKMHPTDHTDWVLAYCMGNIDWDSQFFSMNWL